MNLVLGPDLQAARRFAKDLGSGWMAAEFGAQLSRRFDNIVIIDSQRIQFQWFPKDLRSYIWEVVKTLPNIGCERNIRIL